MLHICLALIWTFSRKCSNHPQLTPFFLIRFPFICIIVIIFLWSAAEYKNHLGIGVFKLLYYRSECGNTCSWSYHYEWLIFIETHSAFFQPCWYYLSMIQLTKPPWTNSSNQTIEFSFELCDSHSQINSFHWFVAWNAVLSYTLPPNTLNKVTQRHSCNLKIFHYFKNVPVLSLAVAEVLTFSVCCLTGEMF